MCGGRFAQSDEKSNLKKTLATIDFNVVFMKTYVSKCRTHTSLARDLKELVKKNIKGSEHQQVPLCTAARDLT